MILLIQNRTKRFRFTKQYTSFHVKMVSFCRNNHIRWICQKLPKYTNSVCKTGSLSILSRSWLSQSIFQKNRLFVSNYGFWQYQKRENISPKIFTPEMSRAPRGGDTKRKSDCNVCELGQPRLF